LWLAVLLHAPLGHADESAICCRAMLRTADSPAWPAGILALSPDSVHVVFSHRGSVHRMSPPTAELFRSPPVLVSLLI